jgi:hypothetical protein
VRRIAKKMESELRELTASWIRAVPHGPAAGEEVRIRIKDEKRKRKRKDEKRKRKEEKRREQERQKQ